MEPARVPDAAAFRAFRQQCEGDGGWQSCYGRDGLAVCIQAPPPGSGVHRLKVGRPGRAAAAPCEAPRGRGLPAPGRAMPGRRPSGFSPRRGGGPGAVVGAGDGTGGSVPLSLLFLLALWDEWCDGISPRGPLCRIDIPDVPAETVYDVLHDIEYRRKWDTNVIDTHDIAQVAANADVGYYAWRCPKPLKNRDVVTLRSWQVQDGYHAIINFSVKHPKYPPRKDLVRAVSLLTGYLVHSTGPSSCSLTYLAQVDPKGSLPKWVVNKASQYLAPRMLKKLYKACVKYPAWKQQHDVSLKPWLYPEQNKLPPLELSELVLQHAASLENIDESSLSEVKEERGDHSGSEN